MNLLEELCNLQVIARILYGIDQANKPNNHCYWDEDYGWLENDEHFKQRIKERMGK